jgi:glycosidase
MSDMNRLIICEINTWVWLHDLEEKTGMRLTLDQIPEEEWDRLVSLGFTAVWLMGIWTRSPLGRRISQANVDLYGEYAQSLPDWKMEDLPGSPYCVKEYTVDPRFGGNPALLKLYAELKLRGLKLILDFVPNHTAQDHKWVSTHPDYYIHGSESDYLQFPRDYFQSPNGVFCKGRDPFFPPWQDVAQLNAYSLSYRKEAADQLEKIAAMCDGVRCDMAMLLINRVFSYTWQNRAGNSPESEFWQDITTVVHGEYPEFIFIAEAYWNLEWDLMQMGFNYCYDKRLYDRLMVESAETIKLHLQSDIQFQSRLVRFIENHDEPRIAGSLPAPRMKAAAIVAFSLPGAIMIYEGQWEGRKIRNHVLLGRRQPEEPNSNIQEFYQILLQSAKNIPFDGVWKLCDMQGWPDNQSFHNLIAYCWQFQGGVLLIIVNYCENPSQGKIILPWVFDHEKDIQFNDLFGKEAFIRKGSELANDGLFVELPAWGFHYLSILP